MFVVQHAVLHCQKQFGAPGVVAGLFVVLRQHLRSLSRAGGLMNLESTERDHRVAAPVFFFSCSAFQTRSGVSGSLRMRTPVA